MATMNMAGMAGMTMGPTTSITSKTATSAMTMATTMASSTMNGQAMASAITKQPTAGMYTMSTIQDMCSLPGMQTMCQDSTRALIGVCAALLVLATAAVILRLASRRMSALTFWWDDVAIIGSLIVSYACSAITFVDAKSGVGRHFETVREDYIVLLLKTTIAYQVLYSICITLVKVSILLFYYRIFGVRKAFRKIIIGALVLVTCWCIAIVLLNILQCIPVQAAWIRPYPHSKCINNNTSLLGTAITNVVIDLGILILPIEPIWRLNLTLRKKLALTAIFCIGAFICAAAMIRVWAIRNVDQTDVTWSYVRPLTWSGVEISIGITCACLPILQPLLQATFGSCFGRSLDSSGHTGRHNTYGNSGKHTPSESHTRPQVARRSTSDYSRFGQKQGDKGRGALTTWTEIEAGETGTWSDDGIPLNGIHVTKEVDMDTTDRV